MSKTQNKSITFTSDRGNDIYSRENEMIRIKIDPSTCSMLNTKSSFLRYSLKINFAGYNVIPDPKILHPFKNIYIYDGNETCLLEQMSDVQISHALRNFYGLSENDEKLQGIFEGRSSNNFNYSINNADRTQSIFNNVGGGFQSPFRKYENPQTNDNISRKAEMIYNFPLSGLLGASLNYVLPVIALNGIVIRLELIDPEQYFKLQYSIHRPSGQNQGYGLLVNSNTPADPLEPNGNFAEDGAGNYIAGVGRGYEIYGYVAAGAGGAAKPAETVGNIPATTDFDGVILKKSGDGAAIGMLVDHFENCSIMPGSYIKVGVAGGVAAGQQPLDGGNPVKIASVKQTAGDRICVIFETAAQVAAQADAGFPVMNDVVTNLANNKPTFEVSDVQYIANVVQTDPQLVAEMVSEFQAGRLPLPIKCYYNQRVNLTANALNNEVHIPSSLRFVYSVMGISEINRAYSVFRSDVTPLNTGLSSYQYVLDGINTPNLPIQLDRVAANRVNSLHIKETEKALKETSITVKNLINPHLYPIFARRLGVYSKSGQFDGTYNCLEKPIKLRVNYTAQANNLVYNMLFFHYKQIKQEGMRRIVIE